MRIKPFFKGERATKILKAFLINAFVAALLSTIIVEVRRDLDNEKTIVSQFIDSLVQTFDPNPFRTDFRKMVYTFFTGFIVSVLLYNFLYLLIGFGGGMVATKKIPQYF